MRLLERFVAIIDRRPIVSAIGATLGLAAGFAWAMFNGWL